MGYMELDAQSVISYLLEIPSVMEYFNGDELLAKEDLKSISAIKVIKKDVQEITQKYKNITSDKRYETQASDIKEKIKALQKRAKHIKSIEDISAIVADAKSIKSEIKTLNDEIKGLKKDYLADKKIIKQHIHEIKTNTKFVVLMHQKSLK